MNCNSNTTPLINEISGVSCNSGCTPKDINVICKTIVIPNGQEILAIQGENNAAVRYFLVPKINENNVDMSDKTFTINIKTNSGSIISRQIEEPEILENYIKLKLEITEDITKESGIISLQIVAISDNFVWKSYSANFKIASSL